MLAMWQKHLVAVPTLSWRVVYLQVMINRQAISSKNDEKSIKNTMGCPVM